MSGEQSGVFQAERGDFLGTRYGSPKVRGGQRMRFCEFIRKLYNSFPCSNQGQFVLEIFSALCGETNPAGENQESSNKTRDFRCSNFLPVGLAGEDPTYRKRLFGRAKKYNGLSAPIKAYIQGNKNKETFIAYCDSSISSNGFPKLCESLGVHISLDRTLLFKAIYEQFLEFAISKNDEVNFILPDSIDLLQNNPKDNTPEDLTPLYNGDDIFLLNESPKGCHQVMLYEIFDHQWVIKNTGTVTWIERFFEFTNQAETRIRPLEIKIAVPATRPGGEISLATKIDARHFEGTFVAIWEMKDGTGQLCFPDKNKALKLKATVTNIPNTAAEV